VRDFPSPTFSALGTPPSLLCVFFVVIAYFSVFFPFFPGWVSVCPGDYADLPRVVCGSTTCRLAHFVVRIFPRHLWCGSCPGFSV
jgi:hypothetical protein